jgi:hypothetical protein
MLYKLYLVITYTCIKNNKVQLSQLINKIFSTSMKFQKTTILIVEVNTELSTDVQFLCH